MDKIFGRDEVIALIWKLLKEDSLLFTAERRVGKTTVLNQLKETHIEGYRVIYSDLEKIDSPLEFVNDVFNKTAPFISIKDRASGWFNKLWESLGGVEVGGLIKIPAQKEKDWKEILEATINAICSNTSDTVVFLWDEVPYMLQKINAHEIANGSVEKSSLKIMDALRALRQEQKGNLRMVFTGSIGLHHVLNTLIDETYASAPVNDMEKVELSPLDSLSAQEMAEFHIKKEGRRSDIDRELVEAITQQCNFIPFYIEKLIRRLAIQGQQITVALVNKEITHILTDANDDWELEHFRTRLGAYYKDQIMDTRQCKIKRSAIAKAILNHCAAAKKPQSIDECYQAVKSSFSIDERDVIITTLKNLVKDHYLLRDDQGNYHFYFSLVQRWWVLAEGLNTTGCNDNA